MVQVPTLAQHLHYLIFQHSVSKLFFSQDETLIRSH